MSDTRAPQQPASEADRLRELIERDRHDIVVALYGADIAAQRGYQAGDLGRLIALAAPAAQQPAEPLTDERIAELHHESFVAMPRRKNSYILDPVKFARAIERAALAHPPAADKKESA